MWRICVQLILQNNTPEITPYLRYIDAYTSTIHMHL